MSINTKSGKKDQSVAREVREEVNDVTPDATDNPPLIKKPNRDQARGDWDRSRGGQESE
jgi:hypothetical protein